MSLTPEQTEPPANHLRYKRLALVVVPVLAGLTLAACTQGTNPNAGGSVIPKSTAYTSSPSATATPSVTISPETTISPTATTPQLTPARKSGLAGCEPYFDTTKYVDHEYEVCTAYVANSAQVALQGFYKYGNHQVGYIADGARHHFETRYWNQPRQTVEQRVDSWPKTTSLIGNKVKNSITVLALSSSLADDRAVLQTEEQWRVTAPDGAVLYDQPLQQHDATMCRGKLAGHLLHEWVVVSDIAQPGFDCRGFDTSHNITP